MGILVSRCLRNTNSPKTHFGMLQPSTEFTREGGNAPWMQPQPSSRAAPRSACFPVVLFTHRNELTPTHLTRATCNLLPVRRHMILELSLTAHHQPLVSPLMSDLISAPLMAPKWDHFSVGVDDSESVMLGLSLSVSGCFSISSQVCLACHWQTKWQSKVCILPCPPTKATPWDLRTHKVHAVMPGLYFLHGVVHPYPCLPKPHCPSSLHADWFFILKPFFLFPHRNPTSSKIPLPFTIFLDVSSCYQPHCWSSRSLPDLALC